MAAAIALCAFSQSFTQCRTITGLAFDDSVLWIGTKECGVGRFVPASGQMSFLTNLNSGLPTNAVNCLVMGRNHELWIGTDAGLSVFDGQSWRIFNTGNAPFPLNPVSAVACGDSGTVWVGFNKGGVLIYANSTWTNLLETRPGFPFTLATHAVMAIAPVNGHDAWISWTPSIYTDLYYLAFTDENGWHTYGYVPGRAIAADKDGAVWFPFDEWIAGTHVFGLNRLRYPDSLTFYPASPSLVPSNIYWFTGMAIDGAGRKWTGAGNYVLFMEDTEFSRPPFIDGTPAFGYFLSFTFDNSGTAWAGFSYTDRDAVVACLAGDTTWVRYPVIATDVSSAFRQDSRPNLTSDDREIQIFVRGNTATLYAASSRIVSAQIINAAGGLAYRTNQGSSASQKSMVSLPALPSGFFIARSVLLNGDGKRVFVQKKFVIPGR